MLLCYCSVLTCVHENHAFPLSLPTGKLLLSKSPLFLTVVQKRIDFLVTGIHVAKVRLPSFTSSPPIAEYILQNQEEENYDIIFLFLYL